jgi:hypothetical protein
VDLIREWIEGFLRGRYGFEGDQAFRVLAVPVLIGAILLAGWLLVGPLLTIPRFWTEGPMVRNGNVVVVVCGKVPQRRGVCTVWYNRLPDWHQRQARQERAVSSPLALYGQSRSSDIVCAYRRAPI